MFELTLTLTVRVRVSLNALKLAGQANSGLMLLINSSILKD